MWPLVSGKTKPHLPPRLDFMLLSFGLLPRSHELSVPLVFQQCNTSFVCSKYLAAFLIKLKFYALHSPKEEVMMEIAHRKKCPNLTIWALVLREGGRQSVLYFIISLSKTRFLCFSRRSEEFTIKGSGASWHKKGWHLKCNTVSPAGKLLSGYKAKTVNFFPTIRLAQEILKRKFPSVDKPIKKGLWKNKPWGFRNFTVSYICCVQHLIKASLPTYNPLQLVVVSINIQHAGAFIDFVLLQIQIRPCNITIYGVSYVNLSTLFRNAKVWFYRVS